MPKMHEHTKQVHLLQNLIREDIARFVQVIYTAWGMTDNEFCTHMGKELDMSRERVNRFLCQECRIHDELTCDRLLDILDIIFAKYVNDEQKKELWSSIRGVCVRKISYSYRRLEQPAKI